MIAIVLETVKSMVKNLYLLRTFVLCHNVRREKHHIGERGERGWVKPIHHNRKADPSKSINFFIHGVEPP